MQRTQLSKNYVANHYHPQLAPNCPYYKITQQETINNNFVALQNNPYDRNGPVNTAPPPYDPYGQMTPQNNPYSQINNSYHAAPRLNVQFRPQNGQTASPSV